MHSFDRSSTQNSMYIGESRTIFSFLIKNPTRSLLKIVHLLNPGLPIYFSADFQHLISLNCIYLRLFTIDFPNMQLFINFQKAFSKSFLACALFCVLKLIYLQLRNGFCFNFKLCISFSKRVLVGWENVNF